jgi:hypothetical protein
VVKARLNCIYNNDFCRLLLIVLVSFNYRPAGVAIALIYSIEGRYAVDNKAEAE